MSGSGAGGGRGPSPRRRGLSENVSVWRAELLERPWIPSWDRVRAPQDVPVCGLRGRPDRGRVCPRTVSSARCPAPGGARRSSHFPREEAEARRGASLAEGAAGALAAGPRARGFHPSAVRPTCAGGHRARSAR